MEKNRESMHAIMQNEGFDRTAKQDKVKALQEQHKKDMGNVLSKEQLKQWEDMQKNRMHKGPKMQGMHKHGVV